MDSAFDFIEARPASGPLIFTVVYPSGAGLASVGSIPLIVKRIIRDFVFVQVGPNRFPAPIGHWVELDDIAPGRFVEGIDLQDADARASVGLLPAQSRYPTIQVRQLISEWQNFSNGAAEVGIGFPEFWPIDVSLFFNGQIGFQRLDLEQ